MPTLTPIIAAIGAEAFFNYPTGLDSNGNPAPITARSATIDNYTDAYVANNSGSGQLFVVAKVAPPVGGSLTVNVTLNAEDANGNAIAPVVQPVTFQGAPPPLPAVSLSITGGGSIGKSPFNVDPDPGADTITF